MSKAAWLYYGNVMHARLTPKAHRFNYKVFSLLVDVDKLAQANKLCPIFSINKANLVSFYEKDHIRDTQADNLREMIEVLLQKDNIDIKPSKILLGCYPRIFGQVFNPLSIYYIYDQADILHTIIYEVRNTFGEQHRYICPLKAGEFSNGVIKQEQDKDFYVSPFMPMQMRYFFTLSEPNSTMSWRILEKQNNQPVLSATYFGHKKSLNTKNLSAFLLQLPFLTWKILVGIHFEALRLWLKGVKLVPRFQQQTK